MKPKSLLLIPALICCFVLSALAGDIQSLGVPFVQNYPKSAYRSGNQNWSVSKGPNGVMYFGNSGGLLSFDGKFWQLYRMPNGQIVRSVAADKKGRVYTGGFGEFGYWSYNSQGKFEYKSLITKVPRKHALSEEIWKIDVDGKRVIFQSFSKLYIYSGDKISVVEPRSSILFLFKANNRYFVEVLADGLFELKGNSLKQIISRQQLPGNILSILPFTTNSFIIGTAKNGLFVYDEQGIRPWQNQAQEFLKKYQLNNGVVIGDKYLAYGTILSGIVVLDKSGNLVQRIDKSSGLQNNTVLNLYTDDRQNLWAGLDNGIDRIDVNSPLYFYLDKTGKFGTVYSSIIHKDKIYLGTNQGLYYSDWSWDKRLFQSFDFKLIEGTQGQVWNLALLNNQLICGHNEGTFLVDGASVEKISDVGGGWTIGALRSHPDVLVQGTYTGLVIFKKNSLGKWYFSHKVENFGAPSRFVEQDSRGNLWVSHAYRGLYKLVLTPDLKKVVSQRSYNTQDGLPGNFHVNVFTVNNQLLFSSGKGLYSYDFISDKFTPYGSLNQGMGTFRAANNIIRADGNKNWFINNGRIALADFSEPGKMKVDSNVLNVLNGRMVQFYENINRISANMYLVSVDDGFVIYNAARPNGKNTLPAVLIRKVENITGSPVTLIETPAERIEIPFKRNSIRISFSLPHYSPEDIRYQYFLEGYSDQWSDWSTQAQKEFSNLPSGSYTFMVRAKVNDRTLSESTRLEFEVLTPRYSTFWAWIIYAAILA
ncbi:MAG TPA: triple tyrosine motif-containing protein, partial [Sphingobacteriaceae bacterium]